MKRLLAGVVGGAAALSVVFGAGFAGADNEYKGRTFAQVQEATGGQAIVASRTGSYLATEECIVTGNRRATYGNGNTKILVDLNCNDIMTAGHPGYSASSEQGKRAQKLRRDAANISNNYEKSVSAGKDPWCADPETAQRCLRICEQSGSCSEELLDFLGL